MMKTATYAGEPIETGSELWPMFRARAQIFRDRLGWDVDVEDGLEIDRYDRFEAPIYLLAYDDDDGRLVGSMRFLPTIGETMLNNEFATMFSEPIDVRSPKTWECTRFSVHPGASNFQDTSRELFLGMYELAHRFGVEHIVALYDDRMTRIYRRIGWSPTEIARAERPGEMLIVGIWDVGIEALAAMRSKREASRLRRRKAT